MRNVIPKSQTRLAFLPSRQKASTAHVPRIIGRPLSWISSIKFAISEAHLTGANEEEENSISPFLTLQPSRWGLEAAGNHFRPKWCFKVLQTSETFQTEPQIAYQSQLSSFVSPELIFIEWKRHCTRRPSSSIGLNFSVLLVTIDTQSLHQSGLRFIQ